VATSSAPCLFAFQYVSHSDLHNAKFGSASLYILVLMALFGVRPPVGSEFIHSFIHSAAPYTPVWTNPGVFNRIRNI
jgi:hypothetical protein